MKQIALLIFTLPALVLTGCLEKPDSEIPAKEAGRVVEMQVPAGFDWSATQNVLCNVVSETPAKVFVSTSADAEPFAVFHAGAGAAPVTLNVPSQYTTLYISCRNSQGLSAPQPASVSNGAVTFNTSDGRYDNTPMEEDKEGAVIYMPSRQNGWGTLMFEDLWPSYGDYDFNDIVIKYQIRHTLTDDNRVASTRIVVRMAALGGSLPYDLFLQMHAVRNAQIADVVELYPAKNAVGNAGMELFPPYDAIKDRAFFRFYGIRANINRPLGSPYLNTTEGAEIPSDKLVEVAYEIRYVTPVGLKDLEFNGLDFYVAQIDEAGGITKEIHRFGYEPVNTNLYFSLVSDPRLNYYQSKDNLVWAINVPADIRHAYEKVDFLKAYPEFKTWAQSSGREAQDWYLHGEDSYLVTK